MRTLEITLEGTVVRAAVLHGAAGDAAVVAQVPWVPTGLRVNT